MDTTDNISTGHVRFQLALPRDLAKEFSTISGVTVEETAEAPARVQHELALETVATVVTILVNLDKLVPTCKRIAEQIHRFFSGSGSNRPRVKVIGEHDETVIEIDLSNVGKTADAIRVVVKS